LSGLGSNFGSPASPLMSKMMLALGVASIKEVCVMQKTSVAECRYGSFAGISRRNRRVGFTAESGH